MPYRVAEESDAPVSDDQLDHARDRLLECVGGLLEQSNQLLASIQTLYAGANSEFSRKAGGY